MTEARVSDAPRSAPSSPIAAVGSLVAARDLEELALAAALIPAQLLAARETVVVLQAGAAEIVQHHPVHGVGPELEGWARGELARGNLASGDGERVSREGSWLAVTLEPVDGWSGVVGVSVASVDEETTCGL